jgi:hypothetical protein
VGKRSSETERGGFWSRLDTPTKVLAAIVVTVTAVGGWFVAIFGNPFADDPRDVEARRDPTAVAARQVAKCMESHHLHAPTEVDLSVHRVTFRRCDWPSVVRSGDAYSEIVDSVLYLPKYNAAAYNTIDTFRASCEHLDVTYVLDHMSGRQFIQGLLNVERVFLVGFHNNGQRSTLALERLDRVPEDVHLPLPSATSRSFYVLRSGHFSLFEAKCAPNHPVGGA